MILSTDSFILYQNPSVFCVDLLCSAGKFFLAHAIFASLFFAPRIFFPFASEIHYHFENYFYSILDTSLFIFANLLSSTKTFAAITLVESLFFTTPRPFPSSFYSSNLFQRFPSSANRLIEYSFHSIL